MAPASCPVILLIEDNCEIREALDLLLQARGYTTMLAANGAEALDILAHAGRLPCAIVLDLMMPLMNGWEFRVAQRANTAWAKIPVIVYSGYDVEPFPNVAAYLRESTAPDVLLETVARVQRSTPDPK